MRNDTDDIWWRKQKSKQKVGLTKIEKKIKMADVERNQSVPEVHASPRLSSTPKTPQKSSSRTRRPSKRRTPNGTPGTSPEIYTISEEFMNIQESATGTGNRCLTGDSSMTSFSVLSNGQIHHGSQHLDRSSLSSGSQRVNVTLERSKNGDCSDAKPPKEPSVILCCSKEEAEDFQVRKLCGN